MGDDQKFRFGRIRYLTSEDPGEACLTGINNTNKACRSVTQEP